MKSIQIYLFFSLCFFVASCNNKKSIDVSHIKLSIPLERFDRELNSLGGGEMASKASILQEKYGWFYRDYMEQMLGVGPVSDQRHLANVAEVLKNPDYRELRQAVEATFRETEKYETELNEAFKHIKYYYPATEFPRLITFISGFAVQTPIGNDYIGIGLDMFLGKNGNKFYPALRQSIPQYIARRFTPENITPRVIEAFLREEMFPEQDADRTMLAKMIYNGKILYMMDQALPDVADTLKIGYTEKQLEWCKEFEGSIWAYFLNENLIYEADYLKIQKYLTEAPFTPGIGEGTESAPKLAVWIGWQIVREYMDRNPELSVQQLMRETNAQEILNKSKYKPKL